MKICRTCTNTTKTKHGRYCSQCIKKRNSQSQQRYIKSDRGKKTVKNWLSSLSGKQYKRRESEKRLSTHKGLIDFVESIVSYIEFLEQYRFQKIEPDFYEPYITQEGCVWHDPCQNDNEYYYDQVFKRHQNRIEKALDKQGIVKTSFKEVIEDYEYLDAYEREIIKKIKSL